MADQLLYDMPTVLDQNAQPVANGSIEVYEQNTTALITTLVDASGDPLGNPISLDAGGRPSDQVFYAGGTAVDIVIKDSAGVQLRQIVQAPRLSSADAAASSVTFAPISENSATDVQTGIANNANRIAAAEDEIASNTTRITAVEPDVSSNTSRIATIETALDGNTAADFSPAPTTAFNTSLQTFAIGTTVLVRDASGGDRTSLQSVNLSTVDNTRYVLGGGGATLTGSWRARGYVSDGLALLMQRIA